MKVLFIVSILPPFHPIGLTPPFVPEARVRLVCGGVRNICGDRMAHLHGSYIAWWYQLWGTIAYARCISRGLVYGELASGERVALG